MSDAATIVDNVDVAPAPSYFLYSNPVVYTPAGQAYLSVYEGLSSAGEPCPMPAGGLVQIDAANGVVQQKFIAVPQGCKGASAWGPLAIKDY